jgi:UDP-glucose 4-epimerase
MNPRVLITGANGFIGSHTLLELERHGAKVVATDALPRHPDLDLLRITTPTQLFDIRDRAQLVSLCADGGITHIVHLAHPTREGSPASLDVLLEGIRNLFEVGKECGVRRMVYASSGSIYGRVRKDDGSPIGEDDPVPIFPNFMYRSAKMLGEWLGEFYTEQLGIGFVALRFAYVYGPGQWFGIGQQLKSGLRGEMIQPTLTREPYDDLVHVADVARAVRLAVFADHLRSRAYNIAADRTYVNADLAAAIRAAAPEIVFELGTIPNDVATFNRQRDTLDVTRASEQLGWKPEYDLTRGIAATIAALRAAIHDSGE